MSIGGNVYALLQVKNIKAVNAIGEPILEWLDCATILGWLDLSAGDSKHTNFNAKIQESTHIFLCDFTCWNKFSGIVNTAEQEAAAGVTSENARMVVNGSVYEILLIDNPMSMNEHLEIYLRYVGGGRGVN